MGFTLDSIQHVLPSSSPTLSSTKSTVDHTAHATQFTTPILDDSSTDQLDNAMHTSQPDGSSRPTAQMAVDCEVTWLGSAA